MALVAIRAASRTDLSAEEVARRIIAHASAGERDPERLGDFALLPIEPHGFA